MIGTESVHAKMARYADIARTAVRMTPGQTLKLTVPTDRHIDDLTHFGLGTTQPAEHFREQELRFRFELSVKAGEKNDGAIEFEANLSTEALPVILTQRFSLAADQPSMEQSLFYGKFLKVKTWQGSGADCIPDTWETVEGHQFTLFAARVPEDLELFLYKYAPALPNPHTPIEYVPLNLMRQWVMPT